MRKIVDSVTYSSQYVTKLVFSPIRFVKWKDPYAYQTSVKKRLERDTFSHNTFALAFGKHVAAYKGYLEAQHYLSKNAQDLYILVRALRRLPRIKNVTVVFNDQIIGAQEIMSAFGLLNGDEVTLDAEYTLQILVGALIESERQPEVLNLCSEQRPSIELLDISRQDFVYEQQTRFKYASTSPKMVTAKAFREAFQGSDRRTKVITLVQYLREFELVLPSFDNESTFALHSLSNALEPITVLASRLEELTICAGGTHTPTAYGSLLQLDMFFSGSFTSHCLRYLDLTGAASPAPLLTNLITQNSGSLIHVCLHYMRIIGDGSWSGMLDKLRTRNFRTLQTFWLVRCEGAKGVIAVQDYIKCITSKDPVVTSNNQADDSD